jgi:hypothetical protein
MVEMVQDGYESWEDWGKKARFSGGELRKLREK